MMSRLHIKLTMVYFAFGILLYLAVCSFPGQHWHIVVEALSPIIKGMHVTESVNRHLGLDPHPAQIMLAYGFFFWFIFVLCLTFVYITDASFRQKDVDSFLAQRKNKSKFRNIGLAMVGCIFSFLFFYVIDIHDFGEWGGASRYAHMMHSSFFLSVAFQLITIWCSSQGFVFYLLILPYFTLPNIFKRSVP